MIQDFFLTLFLKWFEFMFSIQIGSLLIAIGSLIYAPTGSQAGKYFLLLGLLIFTINLFV